MGVYLKGFLIACRGIPATVAVSLIAIVIGAAFGLLLALCSQTKSKILQVLAKVYIDVVRGTPMLVQALIMAYGIPWLLQSWGIGFKWDNYGGMVVPAVIVCGFNSAAYLSEVIRSGIQAIDKGQMEAARSLGMSHGMAMRLVIIPQAIRIILPAFANEFVTLIKETSVLGYVGVVGKAHGNIVFVFVYLKTVAGFKILPAGHFRIAVLIRKALVKIRIV